MCLCICEKEQMKIERIQTFTKEKTIEEGQNGRKSGQKQEASRE